VLPNFYNFVTTNVNDLEIFLAVIHFYVLQAVIYTDLNCFILYQRLDKEWTSLTSLVTHHTVMRELLPCPLRLPRTANNPAFNDDEKSCEQEEDEDYQRLADFSHMMQDLKM
jgi:hypothetical protein